MFIARHARAWTRFAGSGVMPSGRNFHATFVAFAFGMPVEGSAHWGFQVTVYRNAAPGWNVVSHHSLTCCLVTISFVNL